MLAVQGIDGICSYLDHESTDTSSPTWCVFYYVETWAYSLKRGRQRQGLNNRQSSCPRFQGRTSRPARRFTNRQTCQWTLETITIPHLATSMSKCVSNGQLSGTTSHLMRKLPPSKGFTRLRLQNRSGTGPMGAMASLVSHFYVHKYLYDFRRSFVPHSFTEYYGIGLRGSEFNG